MLLFLRAVCPNRRNALLKSPHLGGGWPGARRETAWTFRPTGGVRCTDRQSRRSHYTGGTPQHARIHTITPIDISSRSMSQSLSLSQELSSARSRKASISSHGTSSSISLSPSGRPALSLSISPNERSVQSLEAEIKRLQEILVERESEIGLLEQSLKDKEREAVLQAETPSSASTTPATPENGEANPMMHLSPKTINHFQELRSTLDHSENDSNVDAGEDLDRLNELMR